jgi:hypothetical protein
MSFKPWFYLAASLLVVGYLTFLSPLEKTLGANARIVYLHGALVWVALAAILAAGVAGAFGLLFRAARLHAWSQALGRTGLLLWLVFLPMSLYVMQANWNGLFLDEPRFRIPLNFAIVGLLLQVGLSFLPDLKWTSWGNLGFSAALMWGMFGIDAVMHPDSPVMRSGARDIQLFFLALLVVLLLVALQIARLFLPAAPRNLRY